MLNFCYKLIEYARVRLPMILTWLKYLWSDLDRVVTRVKRFIIVRMFWGRGNWYKHTFHFSVAMITGVFLLTGILGSLTHGERVAGLASLNGSSSNEDVLYQGSGISGVVATETGSGSYAITLHRVIKGETLATIAERYNVEKDTVLWANSDRLNPFDPRPQEGTELQIPEIDGVLYTVKDGDTLDKIVNKTKGNEFDIIEINQLVPPEYKLVIGQRLFVPEGELPTPAVPGLYREFFADPLSHPTCVGRIYWMRGFTGYHKGVDLAHPGGCPIRAVAAGRVVYAGWKDGRGYMIQLDHGGNVVSDYYHGNGTIWVKPGQYVQQGQELMFMGSTGNSTGVHLHFGLKKNGVFIDPAPFVPYSKRRLGR